MKTIKNYRNEIGLFLDYIRKKTKLSHFPTRLWIELTNHCNLKCIFCPQSKNRNIPKGFMEFSLFKKIVDEIKEFANDSYLHLGGESLLHKDIFKMIRYMKDNNIKPRLHSNMTILDEEKAHKLINSGLDYLSISFDADDKETYEKYQINANFETTISNIVNFLKIKKRLKSKKPYTLLKIIRPYEKGKKIKPISNIFINKFKNLKLDKFVVVYPRKWGDNFHNTDKFSYMPFGKDYFPCWYLWYAMSITWDGKIVPCCQTFNYECILGDANKQSIKEAWNSEALINMRRLMINKQYREIPLCKNCEILWPDWKNRREFSWKRTLGYYFIKLFHIK